MYFGTLPDLEIFRRFPSVHPFDERSTVNAELDGQPDVAGINGVLWTPDVGHEDEGVLFALHGQDVGALSAKREVGFRAYAGIGVLRPRAIDVVSREHACFVGIPSCTS